MSIGARDEGISLARLTDGQAELALGVRRRRWVLGVLAFIMMIAVVAAGVIGLRMAPEMDRDADVQAGRFQAIETASTTVEDVQRAQLVAFAERSPSDLRRAADLRTRLAPVVAALSGSELAPIQNDVTTLADAAADVDAGVERAADLLQDGDLEGAADVMADEVATAGAGVGTALQRIRSVLDGNALDNAREASRVMRLVALALCIPVIPTGWVFGQLVLGVRQIRRIGTQMHEVSREVSTSAAQLSAASEELAAATVEGAASFSEAMATIEELAQAADAIAESVEGVADQSHDMRSNIEAAGTDIEESSVRLLSLADRVDEIGEILLLINEIADQTNLLALNAAIEAARAGESGKGFTVVAEEVRRLAERSKSSAGQIAEIIEGAQAETSSTVLAMEKGAKQMTHAMAFMDTVAGASNEGRLSAEQQRNATQQVVITFEQLSGNSKAVSATTHQIAASAVGLANLAKQLEDTAANSAAGV